VEEVLCDALDSNMTMAAAQGVQVVVNALNPLYTAWETEALPLAEQGIAVASAAGAVLLYPGNVYNFGPELPEMLDETTSFADDGANTAKGRIRVAIERRLQEAAQQGLVSATIRAGDFFGGAGRGSWFDLAIVKDLAKGKVVYPGPLNRVHAWAYLPDLAETFVGVAEARERLSGASRLHFPGYGVTGEELLLGIEGVVGRRVRRGGMPWGLMRLATPFAPMLRAIFEMRYLWQRPHQLEGRRLDGLLAEVPHTPLREALRGALQALDLLPERGR